MRHVEAFMDQVAWSLPILEASTSARTSQHAPPGLSPRTRLPMLICEGPSNHLGVVRRSGVIRVGVLHCRA